MGDVLKKFGRYFLLDHIAQGGMAEIYRARLAAVDGAGRLMVIKRIQAGFGANNEFLQMFKSEIKVTMGFNHPNIVQLYDFGEEQSQPFIAMEWVDGRNLRQMMTRFSELKQPFPVELAAYIAEQAAAGLYYAHGFKDKVTGASLSIVHRDISPQNIIVSYEGGVKVIDFGIAKANTNSEATRAGVIKGKPSYLSPEQISGDILDGRCDIFALGIVLWEMLCGRKLFQGESDLAVLKQIESCTQHVKAPSTLNPKVPKELDYIVLRALAKQRDKRYQSGEEMQRALHKFLYSYLPEFNPTDLAYYAKDLFKNEIVEDRKKIQRLNDKVEQLLADELPDVPAITKPAEENTTTEVENGVTRAQIRVPTPIVSHGKESKVELDVGVGSSVYANSSRSQLNPTHQRTLGSTGVRAPQQRLSTKKNAASGLLKPLAVAAAAVVALAIFGPDFGVQVPVLSEMLSQWMGASEDARLELQGHEQGVVVAVNGKTVAKSLPAVIKKVPVGTPFRVTVSGPNGGFQQEITLRKGEKRVLEVAFAPPAVAAASAVGVDPNQVVQGKSILLRLNVTPGGGGASVMLNGRPVDTSNPAVIVALDAPLELVAERGGYRSFKREFVLEARQVNGLKEWLMDVPMEPVSFGFLTVHSTPSADATILLDGKPWVRKTPIENEKFPVGTYSIRLNNDVLGMEKTITVQIQEGKAVNRDEHLDLMREPASR
ncbi:serine/threonine-protein kinase [Bdellovibrionota bacterium FG-1]